MNGISVIMPCEAERLPLFIKTKEAYLQYPLLAAMRGVDVEFILVSRTLTNSFIFHEDLKIVNYSYEGEYFNPAMALNIGVKHAKFDHVLITCPEVKPVTDVLNQLFSLPDGNYVCQVYDQRENGAQGMSLVNSRFRCGTPSMYFLALFRKADIETINGWDLNFMGGYAYEDNDFGERFARAGLKHEVRDDIVGLHQWHPRHPLGTSGANRNLAIFESNNQKKITRCERGLNEV